MILEMMQLLTLPWFMSLQQWFSQQIGATFSLPETMSWKQHVMNYKLIESAKIL